MFGLGYPEMIIILIIVLLLFGGKKLPSLAKGLGESIRSFKAGVAESDAKDEKKEDVKNA